MPDRTPEAKALAADSERKRRVVRAGCRLTIELKGNLNRERWVGFLNLKVEGANRFFNPTVKLPFLLGTGTYCHSDEKFRRRFLSTAASDL